MANEFKIKNGFFSEGSSNITGSLNVSAGITGSLQGTASFATTASVNTNGNPLIGGSITSGQVAFGTGSGVIGGDEGLFWDNTNKRLGVGTTSPNVRFHIDSSPWPQITPSFKIYNGAYTYNFGSSQRSNELNSMEFFANAGIASINYSTGTLRIGTSNSQPFTLYTNNTERFKIDSLGNIGINQTTPTALLHVQAQGALSTDIAFRVRNSANTADLLNVAGNGAITGSRINLYTDGASQPRAELGASNVVSSYGISSILGNSNTINLQSGGRANVIGSSNTVSGGSLSVNVIGSGNSGAGSGLVMIGSNNSNHIEKENTVIIGSRIKMPSAGARPYQIKIGTGGNVSTSDIQGSFQLYLNNTDNSDLFLSNKTNLVLSNQTFIAGGTHFEVNATNTVTTHNGVAPTTNILNAFQLYSADRGGTAGKASAHFRAEDGTINVIGDFSGFGTDSPQARLDVRAQGALSTDVAFRVRNSANTLDLTTIQGDGVLNNIGNINVGLATGGSPRDISISGYGNNRLIFNTGYQTYGTNLISVTRRTPSGGFTDNTMLFQQGGFGDGQQVPYRHHYVNPSSYYGSNIPRDGYNAGFMWFKNTATFANLQMKLSPDNALSIYTSSASPIESVITGSGFQIWASGSIGNAYPHIRTQNGSIIKLYQQSAVTSSQGLADVLTNVGLLATGSSIAAAYERLSDFQSPYHYSGNATLGTSTSSTSWIINRIDFTTPGSPITLQGTGSWDNRTSLIYS